MRPDEPGKHLPKKKLPIGISTLANIIEDNHVYIDKTHHIASLVNNGSYYFLSRPRRFGKSCFLDTLKQAFLGNKNLFKGLYLENNWDWNVKYPVIHISFASNQPDTETYTLKDKINTLLFINAENYELTLKGKSYSDSFAFLIKDLYNLYNQKVVILIDEYDKPILDAIEDLDTAKMKREILKGFYSCIKDNDQYLKFVFLTGVTKFSKINLFSGLNNLRDITINSEYADICGYNQSELEKGFVDYLIGVDKTKLKTWYNGYNFGDSDIKKVYNPFDILLFFSNDKQYGSYWFETGTPTFLVKLLEKNQFYFPDMEFIEISEIDILSFDIEQIPLLTLLFQTGYLTIKNVRNRGNMIMYGLSYPNLEVRTCLNNKLAQIGSNEGSKNANYTKLERTLISNDFEQFSKVLSGVFASIPHDWYRNNNINHYEGFYCSIVYSYLIGLGFTLIAEDVTNQGQIDLTMLLDDKIVILEFKLAANGDAKTALQQIKDKNYALKYQTNDLPIYLVGISFDTQQRNLHDFVCEKIK